MNETFKRRLVGLLTLAALALLLSWLLPRPGLRKLEGSEDRVAAMDLTKPGSPAEEILPQAPQEKPTEPSKAKGSEGSTLFPLPADPNAPDLDAAAEEESAPDADVAPPPGPASTPADKAVAESVAAERAAAEKAQADTSAAAKAAADRAAAQKAAADKAASDKLAADQAAAERVAAQKAAVEKAAAEKAAAEKAAAEKAAAEKAAADKAAAAKAAEKPAPAPVAAKPAATTPSTAAAATPSKPATTAAAPPKPAPAGTWYAQCGVYSVLANAQSLRDELAKRGMSCDMTPLENAKGTAYRVRCGPFKSRGEAEIVVSRIRDRVQAIVVDGSR